MVTLRSGASTFKSRNLVGSIGVYNNKTDNVKVNGASDKVKNPEKEIKMPTINSKKMQLVTFISLVIDLLGFTVILPLFPAILEYYSKNDSSGLYAAMQKPIEGIQNFLNVPKEYNSVLFGGIIGSLFSLLQFLSSPICGALSDSYGRKPVVLLTLIGIAISYSLWSVASNFAIFVLARIIGGLSKGNVSLSYSIMTDILDPSSRPRGMALIGVAFSIGFIIGPLVGVGFSKWGSSGWFAASAIYALTMALLNIIFFFMFYEETLPPEKRKKSAKSVTESITDYVSPPRLFAFQAVSSIEKTERNRLKHLGSIYFLYLFIYSGLEFTVTFVTHHHHKFDAMAQGRMFTYLGLVMALVQGGIVRRINAGIEKKICLIGLALMIPSFAIIGISNSTLFLYSGLTLYATGSSLMVPCLTALASKFGPPTQKGTVLGIWRSLGALARAMGPMVACIGFWSLGCAWTYSLGGTLLVIPFLMLYKF